MDRWPVETRFFVGFAVGIVPAALWSLLFFFLLGDDVNSIRWFWGNATFSIHHLVFMPVCLAVFAATADFSRFVRWKKTSSAARVVRLGIPLALITLVLWVTVNDSTAHPIAPYEITDPTKRARAFELEVGLRREWQMPEDKRPEGYQERLKEYKDLTQRPSSRGPIGRVNTFLTGYYGLCIGAIHWYLFLLLWDTTFERLARRREPGTSSAPVPPPFHVGLIFAYATWLTWLPLRIYANWFELHFVNPNWRSDHAAITLVAVLSFLGLIVLFCLSYLDRLPIFIGIVGGLAGVVGTIAGWLNPDWLREFSNFFQVLTPGYYLALVVSVIPVLTVLGLYVVATRISDTR